MPHRHARHRFQTASTKTAVLAVIALAMIIAGLAIYMTRGSGAGNPSNAQSGSGTTGSEIEFLLGGSDSGDDMAGEGMVIQITDKDDPNRLAAEILADRYDPDGPTIRLVEKPKAWLFGEDGAAWLIESDRGRFYIPEGEDQPREGTLTGNVTARRFDPSGSGGVTITSTNRPDPVTDTPALVATTDEPLRFNLDILTFETDGRLEINTDTIDFAGRGAYVVLNESRESITTLRVDQGERLVYTPAARYENEASDDKGTTGKSVVADSSPVANSTNDQTLADATTDGSPAAPAAAESTETPTDSAPEPKIDLYKITFADNVEAVSGPRTITSDTLTVWSRLIDNKLPTRSAGDSAAGTQASQAATSTSPASDDTTAESDEPRSIAGGTTDESNESSQTDDAIASTEADTDADTEQDAQTETVVLTWDGPLTVEPLTDSPAELNRGDDLAMRFEATDGEVEIVDTDTDATARALAANYFAQRERVELEGSGGSIVVASENTGRIEGMNALEVELAAGIITIPTAGELFGAEHDGNAADPDPQTIAWAESASFRFALEDGTMTDRLERAAFRGRVRGANRDATVDGETLVALFETPPGASPQLLQLDVEEAIASDGRGGAVGGETMQVHFAQGTFGEDIDPTRAILTGDAFARRDGRESIRGDRIDADLARDENADVIVRTADATGSVAFDDGAGTAGRGDALTADTLAETAVITGPADPALTWVSRDGTRISGPDIRLDGKSRRVDVFGSGTFAHESANSVTGAPRRIDAAWTDRMAFDDVAGTVLCVGGVSARSPNADGSIDTVTGDRLEITLAPLDETSGDRDGDRLRFADVFGSEADPARVESTRYAALEDAADGENTGDDTEVDAAGDEPDAERAIESLYRLDAARIRFAALDDRLNVPTAGRLFVLDRRPPDGTDEAAQDPNNQDGPNGPLVGGDGSRGSTLITWTGSMDYDRAAGRAVIRDDARIINQPLGEPNPSEVIANTITAAFASAVRDAGGKNARSASGDLRWAIADGDALLRIENDREILADRLIYDPENLRVQALGENGRSIEITDLARGTVSRPRAVIWDLEADRITVTNPGAIVAPE
jgi:lipopolysaccharide export system protein LptA